ncbi:MAG TPA: ROK family protein [Kofleriaceae bacterium]|nr:ROK family protein [Kofleriaceae bacterium]
MTMAMRIGIDLGGTKIEAAALDDKGTVRTRRRTATPRSYDELLCVLAELVRTVESEVGTVRAVGIGTPGQPSPLTGLMANAENTPLQGQPFARDLETVLGRPSRLANDAACFALSEACDGAGAGARVVVGVIAGTGIGGGIVVDGRLLGACEWGHSPLPWAEPHEADASCTCGRHGCIEALLAGPGLARDHERTTKQRIDGATIAAQARAGDAAANASIERHADRMARALASIVNLVDPDVIVLGGGVSRIDALYELVPARLSRWVAMCPPRVRVVRNVHGDASGVRGAAWLWPPTSHSS